MTALYKRLSTKTLLMALFLAGYLLLLAAALVNTPCWNDECHFVDTVMLFKTQPSLATLLHYNEMSTPLPFVLYAIWGTIFGDSLVTLRLFSLLVSFAAYMLFYHLFTLVIGRSWIPFLLVIFLAINPYMAGAGIFVFTDMLMMLFVGVFLISILRRNGWLMLIGGVGGLLCRQYFAFLIAAGIGYFLIDMIVTKEKKNLVYLGVLAATVIPLGALIVVWQGMCPQNEIRGLYLGHSTAFHANSVTLYIIQLFVYLFPVVIFCWKRFYTNRKILLLAAVGGCLYWLFPAIPSLPALDIGRTTVGYFHRAIRIWPGDNFEQPIFFVCFTAALPLVISLAADTIRRVAKGETDFQLFLGLATISFFAIMPFSYMHWEKYFLPMLPIAALYFIIASRPELLPPGQRSS
ncbi:MAG: glycosyltransferase family 39 protein [Chitinispirillaceae bacterium]|jgi:4-amino-4-deoxy-L-arabinose transferase-like glycosyltransferase|nr:glycosyltransferase family 39 protein [Chitinispirillaceae bacterium]